MKDRQVYSRFGGQIGLQQRTAELIELGQEIKRGFENSVEVHKPSLWARRKQRKLDKLTMNQFKQSVYLLEQDIEDLQTCHTEYRNHNPLIPWAKLILGCIGILVSFLWLLQICIVMIIPNNQLGGFLSDYFIWFDKWFALFGTISVGIFSLYLLAAVVKGCFKFGMRCFCFAVSWHRYSDVYHASNVQL